VAMAHRRDHRPQSEKAVIAFNEAWKAERDINGDNVGEWAEKEDFKSGKCMLCQKSFQFNYEGKRRSKEIQGRQREEREGKNF
jgi:hypothetical protein